MDMHNEYVSTAQSIALYRAAAFQGHYHSQVAMVMCHGKHVDVNVPGHANLLMARCFELLALQTHDYWKCPDPMLSPYYKLLAQVIVNPTSSIADLSGVEDLDDDERGLTLDDLHWAAVHWLCTQHSSEATFFLNRHSNHHNLINAVSSLPQPIAEEVMLHVAALGKDATLGKCTE